MIASYPPITAPALVLVGTIMLKRVTEIDWSDFTETLPSLLIVLCIPFFFSIANGIGIGLVAYPLIKLLTLRFKHLNPFNIILGLFFLLYFLFLQ
jgi:AGZA family xanthine/uracil permease-like MFS transporter